MQIGCDISLRPSALPLVQTLGVGKGRLLKEGRGSSRHTPWDCLGVEVTTLRASDRFNPLKILIDVSCVWLDKHFYNWKWIQNKIVDFSVNYIINIVFRAVLLMCDDDSNRSLKTTWSLTEQWSNVRIRIGRNFKYRKENVEAREETGNRCIVGQPKRKRREEGGTN